MNKRVKDIDISKEVMSGITISDLVKVMNACNATLNAHKGVTLSDDQLLLRQKTYKSLELAQSIMIMGLSKCYCEHAKTLNDMPDTAIRRRLAIDFEIAAKLTI